MLHRLKLNHGNDDFFVFVGIVRINLILGIITLIYFTTAIELTLRSILINSILF